MSPSGYSLSVRDVKPACIVTTFIDVTSRLSSLLAHCMYSNHHTQFCGPQQGIKKCILWGYIIERSHFHCSLLAPSKPIWVRLPVRTKYVIVTMEMHNAEGRLDDLVLPFLQHMGFHVSLLDAAK